MERILAALLGEILEPNGLKVVTFGGLGILNLFCANRGLRSAIVPLAQSCGDVMPMFLISQVLDWLLRES